MATNCDLRPHAPPASTTERAEQLGAEDTQIAAAAPLESISAALQRPGLVLSQVVATVMESYAERPALGQRARRVVSDPATGHTSLQLLPEYTTITYGQLWARAQAIASEWWHAEQRLRAGDLVCILGFASIDYTTLDLACAHTGAVSVPLPTNAPVPQLVSIIAETEPLVLGTSVNNVTAAVEAILEDAAPQRLIVFDYQPDVDDHRDKLATAREVLAGRNRPVVVDVLNDVVLRGRAVPPVPPHVGRPDDLASLIYTSGSTGAPKGAMYTDHMMCRTWVRPARVPLISLNYLPMSHQYGRAGVARTLANGGTGYFAAKSDMSTLLEDLALVRPTAINLIPRVCDLIYQEYLAELDRRATPGADEAALAADIKARLRADFLGGRLLSATCGSAPLTAEMHEFIESCLDVHLTIGYGTTETGGVLIDNRVDRSQVIDYKLVDVPELGYYHTDRPHPRGELLVKTRTTMPGYYRRPDVTAAMFDADGYYRTGDIVAQSGPDQLVYLDRRNNVLKLSQGEFVAVAQLEAVFSASPVIEQIFVHGSSEQSFLLAVVVPTAQMISQLDRDGVDAVKAVILASLQQIGAQAELNGYEIPRDCLIETDPFTLQNGLLTGPGKLLRPNLNAHYGTRLEQLYRTITDDRINELRELHARGADRPAIHTVVRAASATLGLAPQDVRDDVRFIDLGGDSLSALSFSKLLEEIYGLEVPVGVVIDPTADLRQIAAYVEAQRGSGSGRVTFAAVHRRGSTEVSASELTLERFIDLDTLRAATDLPARVAEIQTVLLTGASGYLGRFLCLEWMQRLAPSGASVICIARGADAARARERVEDAFDTDEQLRARFSDLARDHLHVLPGDMAEPRLGLDDATWKRLARSVDLIVHPAAHVNHMLPYRQLFDANVTGTAELIRLAITQKLKMFTFVSSMGAAQLGPEVLDEDADVRAACPVRRLTNGYASGYSTSKWAGEVLMRAAHQLCGLPVAVFRPDMILAHSTYAGQLNVPDMITRLLLSLITTGIAPRSFYRGAPHGHGPAPHYDGLPVDFVAAVVTELGAAATSGYHTFNVVNPHEDGVSLDQFVDWLVAAGNPIARIDDYDQWLSQFETALRAQPDKLRQHSALMVLDAFRRQQDAVAGSSGPSVVFQRAADAIHRDIPHLTPALIAKYSNDLRTLGLL